MVDGDDQLADLRSVRHRQDPHVILDPSVCDTPGQESPVHGADIGDRIPHPLRGYVNDRFDADRCHR
jgi:hypothetical protein